MKVGRVLGNVVLSQAIPEYRGARWLLVSPYKRDDLERESEAHVSGEPSTVVYDCLGGSAGDLIGYTEGGEASQPFETPTPVDAYNCILLSRVTFKD